MALDSQTKILLVVGAIMLLIYFLYTQNNGAIQNEGNLIMDPAIVQGDVPAKQAPSSPIDNIPHSSLTNTNTNTKDEAPISANNLPEISDNPFDTDETRTKFDSKNKARKGYKAMNYKDGIRGNVSPSDWESYFNKNNVLMQDSQIFTNNKFNPVDETNDKFASYRAKKSRKPTDEDLFKVDELLPQEVNQDWFEVMPEPISVKNRHLINISKPIGINTIGTSLKNPSYDLRGSPPCPKFVISPWLQSSIEPDTNIKGLC